MPPGLKLYKRGRTPWEMAAAGDLDTVPSTDVVSYVFRFSRGGGALEVADFIDLPIDVPGTILGWRLVGDGQTGSTVIDLWKDVFANFDPTAADTITASAKPTITSAKAAQSTTLTGWTTAVADGDVLRARIDSVSTFLHMTLTLKVRRS